MLKILVNTCAEIFCSKIYIFLSTFERKILLKRCRLNL